MKDIEISDEDLKYLKEIAMQPTPWYMCKKCNYLSHGKPFNGKCYVCGEENAFEMAVRTIIKKGE